VSALDDIIESAREERVRYVAAGPQVTELQARFLEETRMLFRLEPHVVVVASPEIAGVKGRMCFVFADLRRRRRVAIDLVPEKMDARLVTRERAHAVLAGGDVDALLLFRGKDVVRNPDDCGCLLARLEHTMFSDAGFQHACVNANPSARRYPLNRNGTTYVPVPWTTEEGDEATRFVRVVRRLRRFPRKLAA
jgi:hypothetical protein